MCISIAPLSAYLRKSVRHPVSLYQTRDILLPLLEDLLQKQRHNTQRYHFEKQALISTLLGRVTLLVLSLVCLLLFSCGPSIDRHSFRTNLVFYLLGWETLLALSNILLPLFGIQDHLFLMMPTVQAAHLIRHLGDRQTYF